MGLLFDKKLSFIPHIKALKAKRLKALDVLKVLSNTNWGEDRSVLLNLYRFLVRSKLDYGSVVYGSARKSYLKSLDTIHHQGLRLALGGSWWLREAQGSPALQHTTLALASDRRAFRVRPDPFQSARSC